MKKIFTTCCIVFMALSAGDLFAQEVEQIYEKGPISVSIKADAAKIVLSQTVELEIQTKYPLLWEPNLPEITDSNSFAVISKNALADNIDSQNNLVKTIKYRLEPLLPGTHEISPLSFKYSEHDPNNKFPQVVSINTEPVVIDVNLALPADVNEIRKLAATIEPIEAAPFEFKTWILAPIVLILLLLGMVVYFNRKKSKALTHAVVTKLPHEIALERLGQLLSENLPSQGLFKRFYESLSNILRYYIEDRFAIKAPEQTTEEFLIELSKSSSLEAEDKQKLADFLTQCDLVKFAKHTPQTGDIDKSTELAKAFIEKTKQSPLVSEQEGA